MPGRQHKNYVRNWETATHMHSNVFLLCSLRFSSSVWAAWHTHTHEAKRRMIGECKKEVIAEDERRMYTSIHFDRMQHIQLALDFGQFSGLYIFSFPACPAIFSKLRILSFVTSKRRFHDGMLDRNEGIYIFGWWAYATKKLYKWPQYVRTYFMHDALSLRSPVRSLKGLSEWLCPNKPNIFMYK